MSRPVVLRTRPTGLALRVLDRVDFADAHQTTVDPALPSDPDWWRRKLFGDLPGWLAGLVRLRDAAVRPFGLQAAAMTDLPVLAEGPDEVVIGLDDRHLDFRAGVRVANACVTLTTTVGFHNRLGRLYFLPVRPVHTSVVVPSMMRRAARAGTPDVGGVRGRAADAT